MLHHLFVFPHYSKEVLESLDISVVRPELPSLNSEISEIIDVIAPVDAVTGNRENPVTKLLSGSISDEDLAALLPSRYHNTLTDFDFVGMKYQEFIDGVNAAQPVDNTPIDNGSQSE